MKLFRKDEGFTLVELMVVVLIIGILVAIAIPVFNSAKTNAQTKACYSNQRTIEGAANTWEAENGNVTGITSVNSLVPSYLKSEPDCPASTQTTGDYTINATTTVTPACGVHSHY